MMKYRVTVSFKQDRGTYEVVNDLQYGARIDGAEQFLREYPHDKPDGQPIRPYWLVAHGYTELHQTKDHRIKYVGGRLG